MKNTDNTVCELLTFQADHKQNGDLGNFAELWHDSHRHSESVKATRLMLIQSRNTHNATGESMALPPDEKHNGELGNIAELVAPSLS